MKILNNPLKLLSNKEVATLLEVNLSTANKTVKEIKKEYKVPKLMVYHFKNYFMIE